MCCQPVSLLGDGVGVRPGRLRVSLASAQVPPRAAAPPSTVNCRHPKSGYDETRASNVMVPARKVPVNCVCALSNGNGTLHELAGATLWDLKLQAPSVARP